MRRGAPPPHSQSCGARFFALQRIDTRATLDASSGPTSRVGLPRGPFWAAGRGGGLMGRFPRILGLAAAAVLLAAGLSAQNVGGTIFGRIADESGGGLPGVTVTARNVDTGLTRTVVSDAQALYRLVSLPVGSYELTFALSGFATEVRTGIRVLVGQQAEINPSLKVAKVAETVS